MLCYACYMGETTNQVRDHVVATLIRPARQRRESLVRVSVAEVGRALKLRGRNPLICNALRAGKFLAEQHLQIEKIEGPPSGQSSTVVYTYRLEPVAEVTSADRFQQLHGLLRGMFDEDGGGEAFLRREREEFRGLGRKA